LLLLLDSSTKTKDFKFAVLKQKKQQQYLGEAAISECLIFFNKGSFSLH